MKQLKFEITKQDCHLKILAQFQAFLEELEDDEDEDDDYDDYAVFDGYKIYKKIWEKLFPYQREGVKWMWGLYCNKRGGILGDDMGYVVQSSFYIIFRVFCLGKI